MNKNQSKLYVIVISFTVLICLVFLGNCSRTKPRTTALLPDPGGNTQTFRCCTPNVDCGGGYNSLNSQELKMAGLAKQTCFSSGGYISSTGHVTYLTGNPQGSEPPVVEGGGDETPEVVYKTCQGNLVMETEKGEFVCAMVDRIDPFADPELGLVLDGECSGLSDSITYHNQIDESDQKEWLPVWKKNVESDDDYCFLFVEIKIIETDKDTLPECTSGQKVYERLTTDTGDIDLESLKMNIDGLEKGILTYQINKINCRCISAGKEMTYEIDDTAYSNYRGAEVPIYRSATCN